MAPMEATKSLTIKRESADIYTITSNFPYWSDGSPINCRVAFDRKGILCAMRAQAIDSANGLRYLLISPISFKSILIISEARRLAIGSEVNI